MVRAYPAGRALEVSAGRRGWDAVATQESWKINGIVAQGWTQFPDSLTLPLSLPAHGDRALLCAHHPEGWIAGGRAVRRAR